MGLLDILTGGKSKEATRLGQQATTEFRGLELPDIEKMQLELEMLVSQGQLTPEEAQTYLQEQSGLKGISTDPRLQQAQMDALNSLQDISSSGGLTASDRAQLSRIATQEATQARGAREAILQNAQARGMGGSGAELLAQLQNAQDSTTRQSQRDLDVAGMAQERALQALMQAGTLGGQMQAQSFGQQAQVAGAQDAINRFNTQARQSTGDMNVQNRNQAQMANLDQRQRIADSNVGTRNTQQQYNRNLGQQNFENAYRKAGGIAGGLQGQAQTATAQGQGIQNLIGTGLAAGALFAKSDENCKENIEDFDAGKFLDTLTGKKYNYKDPADGKGKFAGVMAQDLEKSEVGKSLVTDTPDGKMVDFSKGMNTILASMAEMNERMKRLEGRKA